MRLPASRIWRRASYCEAASSGSPRSSDASTIAAAEAHEPVVFRRPTTGALGSRLAGSGASASPSQASEASR